MRHVFFSTLVVCFFFSLVTGQDNPSKSIDLPQDPRAWINSGPISTDAMRGKSIVLYFFEEGCPRCREKWPEVLAAAQANQTEPVMLIAVNSGSSPDQIAKYVKKIGINVPVIMDVDRSLERRAGVNEVSLNNIWQARIIGPDGELSYVNGGDIPAAMQKAAASSHWNVDPSSMPAEIIPTWRQVEFGDYASAAKMVSRFARDRKPETKAAGEKLSAYVQDKMQALIVEADQTQNDQVLWKSYRLYETIQQQFAGYDIPASVEEQSSLLAKDDSIQQQIAAMKLWELTQKAIQSGRATAPRIKAMMGKIIERYPDTEAASMAEAALN